jgi:hypothetical protein
MVPSAFTRQMAATIRLDRWADAGGLCLSELVLQSRDHGFQCYRRRRCQRCGGAAARHGQVAAASCVFVGSCA